MADPEGLIALINQLHPTNLKIRLPERLVTFRWAPEE
jgi:hypothetical protein